jgi:glycosyltransferase involved in cell wall biosynthesis
MNNKNKRLALFMPGLYGGGAERTILNLASGLVARGYAVDLVVAEAEGPYVREIPKSVRLVELRERHHKSFRTVSIFPALVRYLRHERPDALLSELHANIVALWARRFVGIPLRLVITEQNTFSQQNQQLSRFYRLLMLQLVRWCYPWADGIVAVSKGVADDLVQVCGIPRHRIQVIYNPIVTPELEKKTREVPNHDWFGSSEPPVILGVGRLTAQKDFRVLIEALDRVRRTHRARLLILGEGEKRAELEALVKRFKLDGNVGLPGFVANPYSYMARASLFVLSSRWEGLPTVLVEALYCGTPIVATDCPSGPREILLDGQYGRLVPVGDAASLSQAIEATLDARPPRFPRESWQPFELETVVEQYLGILLGI